MGGHGWPVVWPSGRAGCIWGGAAAAGRTGCVGPPAAGCVLACPGQPAGSCAALHSVLVRLVCLCQHARQCFPTPAMMQDASECAPPRPLKPRARCQCSAAQRCAAQRCTMCARAGMPGDAQDAGECPQLRPRGRRQRPASPRPPACCSAAQRCRLCAYENMLMCAARLPACCEMRVMLPAPSVHGASWVPHYGGPPGPSLQVGCCARQQCTLCRDLPVLGAPIQACRCSRSHG